MLAYSAADTTLAKIVGIRRIRVDFSKYNLLYFFLYFRDANAMKRAINPHP